MNESENVEGELKRQVELYRQIIQTQNETINRLIDRYVIHQYNSRRKD